MTDLIKQHLEEIKKICEEEGVSYLALFGSHARGDNRSDSDVDLLVEYKPENDFGLQKIFSTEKKLTQLLQKKVDLIPTDSLDKYIAPYIQKDLITIYD